MPYLFFQAIELDIRGTVYLKESMVVFHDFSLKLRGEYTFQIS